MDQYIKSKRSVDNNERSKRLLHKTLRLSIPTNTHGPSKYLSLTEQSVAHTNSKVINKLSLTSFYHYERTVDVFGAHTPPRLHKTSIERKTSCLLWYAADTILEDGRLCSFPVVCGLHMAKLPVDRREEARRCVEISARWWI